MEHSVKRISKFPEYPIICFGLNRTYNFASHFQHIGNSMKILRAFESKAPEIVFEWNDTLTEARGWVVINSLKGGAAGGGTRMRKGLTCDEVISLAKTMEIKFAIAGPPIGGAKSGIDFDPSDPRKNEVLKRWFTAIRPLLKNYYGTGGDLNVDEKEEVIPITASLGIQHPQEGVLIGHFNPDPVKRTQKIHNLQRGVLLPVLAHPYKPNIKNILTVSDLITGYGVAESVRHFYKIYHQANISGLRAIIQGWGNVGASAAYYLASYGVKIVGIIDRYGGLINEAGYTFQQIAEFFETKMNNSLQAESMLSFEEVNARIWDVPADIFIPAAASRLITSDHVNRLIANGLQVIAAGANVPFADSEIFLGPIAEKADQTLSIIPDFIANCGMARTFAYLMSDEALISDETIFRDVSERIRWALKQCHSINPDNKNITKSAFILALGHENPVEIL